MENNFPVLMLGECEQRDESAVKVRVRFAVTGENGSDSWLSPWLPVLQNFRYLGSYTGQQKTELGGNGETGSGGEEAHTHSLPSHTHNITCKPYLPEVGDTVLVGWLPVWQGEGIVIGGI